MQRHVHVALVSAAVLLLQLLQTRLLGVIYWNHVVYFIVTIALLGFGISGTWLSFGPQTRLYQHLSRDRAAALFCLSTIAFFLAAPLLMVSQEELLTGGFPSLMLAATYILAVLPHFFAGWMLGRWFQEFSDQIHSLYFADLIGAALGCLAFALLISPLGLMRLAALCALAGLLPALSDTPASSTRHFALLMVIPVTAFWYFHQAAESLVVSEPTKSIRRLQQYLPPGDIPLVERSEWNAVSRVDLVVGRMASHSRHIFIDGDAIQPLKENIPDTIPPFNEQHDSLLLKKAPYLFVKQPQSVLIIGSGGGLDTYHALRAGARTIDAVEINSTICRLVQHDFRHLTNDLFYRPGVSLTCDEGRSFLRRSGRTWDVILLNSIDTFSAMNSGAYVLSENYLYTLEAFQEYLAHLTPDGMLAVSRWFAIPESLRLFILVFEALQTFGISDPARHVLLHMETHDISDPETGERQYNAWMGLLVKRSPFTDAEREKLRAHLRHHGGFMLYPAPGASGTPEIFENFAAVRSAGKSAQYFAELPFELAPATDDSPFCFNSERWSELLPALMSLNLGALSHGQWPSLILLSLLILSGLLTTLFIFVPLYMSSAPEFVHANRAAIAYFCLLGISFIFIEISLMQRFSLLLGHPSYSLTTTLGSLLLFSGIGSMMAGRFAILGRLSFGAITALGLCAAWCYPSLMEYLLPCSLPARILGVIALVAPLGFFMGMPFPLGLREMGMRAPDLVPWAWGVNGGATVLGSVLAIVTAMKGGFTLVLLLASAGYLLSWACFRACSTPDHPSSVALSTATAATALPDDLSGG